MHFDGHHVLYLWLYIIQYFYLIYFRRSALYNIHHDCILCHLHLYLFMFNFVSLGMPYDPYQCTYTQYEYYYHGSTFSPS